MEIVLRGRAEGRNKIYFGSLVVILCGRGWVVLIMVSVDVGVER